MATYLDRILEQHRADAALDGEPLDALLDAARAVPAPRSFRATLSAAADDELAVIAEIKRRSPSKGHLAEGLDPAQVAVAYALEHELGWVADLRTSLQARRDRLAAGLRDIGLDVSVPQGTYFLQADVRGLGAPDATAFARDLPVSHGVVAIPTAAFTDAGPGGPWSPYLRFAFCKQADVLDEAVRRLHSPR
jgi:aspartate/methionine/tyrosine aminotransferase